MTTDTTATFRARWVFPVEGPPLKGGVVRVVNGRIVSLGPYQSGETASDLGNVALLPSLINAHSHHQVPALKLVTNININKKDFFTME